MSDSTPPEDHAEPFETIDTIPAPALMPTDTSEEQQGAMLDVAKAKEADSAMVSHELARMSEEIVKMTQTVESLRAIVHASVYATERRWVEFTVSIEGLKQTLESFSRRSDSRWSALNERIGASDERSSERFDGVDRRLDKLDATSQATNQILTGVRHVASSALDAATSANKTAKELRKSSIPSGAEDDHISQVGYGSDSKIKL